ncbi:MAG TPA: zf-TFIIB domain-containing protein [Fimbriimonadaceae bacterium]|nr:zf-TFIIB domain-containing protein [Fimbriimonadaceae bacterium]
MECPVCHKEMVTEDFGGVKVDVCRDGCKGMWLDWMELTRLDENNEGLCAALNEALAYPRTNDANRGVLYCPKCHEPLHRHLCNIDWHVSVDECYDCGGFFLDSGELKDIREHHMTEKDIEEYGEKILKGVPEWGQAKMELKDEQTRAEAIRNFTKFLRPSYYMTGK